jgi:hypothetical protein
MKTFIVGIFALCMTAQTIQSCMICQCLSLAHPEQEPTDAAPHPKPTQFDDIIAATQALQKKQFGNAFALFEKLKMDDKISFLKVFFSYNKIPAGCTLTIGQLQQIRDGMHRLQWDEKNQVQMPQAWNVHLIKHTQQPQQ